MIATPRTDTFVTKWRGADPQRAVEAATEEMKALERENAALTAQRDDALDVYDGLKVDHEMLVAQRDQWRAAAEALAESAKPFAEAADSYDPPYCCKDDEAAWDHAFTIGPLRRQREALAAFREAGKEPE
jgi:hypothetical protein